MRDPTREEALEHFGVRGMHWGVRNASDNVDVQVYDDKPDRKIGKKLAIGAVVTAGAVAAAVILSKSGGVSTAGLHSKIAVGAEVAKTRNIKTQAASVGRMAKAFRASGAKNKGFVPEATRLFKGQKYASYVVTHLGGIPVSNLKS